MISKSPRAALAALALLFCSVGAWPVSAQAPYPSQGIRFIVPYAPGGLPDTVARIVGQRLQERVGQNVVVENRPGGGAAAAVSALMSAPADGYTFLVSDGSLLSTNPALIKQLTYAVKDIAPVALLGSDAFVPRRAPGRAGQSTLREFVDYVKARPGQINYGSSGVGSLHHLSMEALKAALQLEHDSHSLSRHRPVGAGTARRARAGAILGLSVAGRRGAEQAGQAARA